MSEPNYVEKLRAIRDRIGQELQQTPWDQWVRQAEQKVRQCPDLARLLDEATAPPPPQSAGRKS